HAERLVEPVAVDLVPVRPREATRRGEHGAQPLDRVGGLPRVLGRGRCAVDHVYGHCPHPLSRPAVLLVTSSQRPLTLGAAPRTGPAPSTISSVTAPTPSRPSCAAGHIVSAATDIGRPPEAHRVRRVHRVSFDEVRAAYSARAGEYVDAVGKIEHAPERDRDALLA